MNNEAREILRFVTVGSVDDGKSTLIGRMLYDSKSIFLDQMDAVEKSSKNKGLAHVDLSLFTDGLKDEREQGITIDVAYRYFATPKRKFIIADCPGHIQYTRNMVTGASTANLALILVDARKGIIEQTKRHSFLTSLLQIPHLIVCVNKMDLVDYKEESYTKLVKDFEEFSKELNVKQIEYIPISALKGDNVVDKSDEMPWYKGGTLLETLEDIEISRDNNLENARFPIQTVIRPHSEEYHDFRGYAGKVVSGVFAKGDTVKLLPSGYTTKIKSIDSSNGELDIAFPPMSTCITLEDDLDLSRGDMIVKEGDEPKSINEFEAMICWLNQKEANIRAKFFLKHTSNEVRAMVKEIVYKIDINTMKKEESADSILMNDILRVKIKTTKPIFADPYNNNRYTGSFILVDETSFETVAAGMILG